MPARDDVQHRLGLLLVLGTAIAWSTAGFFTRLIPLAPLTILVWRGVFTAAPLRFGSRDRASPVGQSGKAAHN